MSELTKQIARAAGELEPAWSDERAARLLGAIQQQQNVRKRRAGLLRGVAVAGVLVLAVAIVGGRAARRSGVGSSKPSLATASVEPLVSPSALESPVRGHELQLSDGSLARPSDEGSQLLVKEQHSSRTVLSLVRGRASFAVVKNPQRLFRVEAGPVAVEVLGTRFAVERLGVEGLLGAQTRVTVSEGRVRVLWAAHYAELTAGQSALFPPDPVAFPATAATAATAVIEPPAPPVLGPPESPGLSSPAPHRALLRRPESKKAPEAAPSEDAAARAATHPVETKARPSWKELAQDGQFDRAYGEAYGGPETANETRDRESSPLRTVEKSPGDLLLLADVARLSHHPADAVAPLERVLRAHGQDPRAPLAAFTLGRVLLDELGRPREAAETFARAQQLDPDGPLDQDALAREVEAWSRAGESERARLRAEEYIRRYPKGRRLRSVRRYGEPD